MSRVWAGARTHPWRALTIAALVLVAALGVANRDMIALAVRPAEPIDQRLPLARPLTASDGEVVYRIDASSSEVRLLVDEVLAGAERQVELVTKGVAGDVAVTDGHAPTVRLGDIVVDGADILGDGVNVAARLESQAPPGGVLRTSARSQGGRRRPRGGPPRSRGPWR